MMKYNGLRHYVDYKIVVTSRIDHRLHIVLKTTVWLLLTTLPTNANMLSSYCVVYTKKAITSDQVMGLFRPDDAQVSYLTNYSSPLEVFKMTVLTNIVVVQLCGVGVQAKQKQTQINYECSMAVQSFQQRYPGKSWDSMYGQLTSANKF